MMDITTLFETGINKCDLSDKSKTGEDKKISHILDHFFTENLNLFYFT